VEDVKKDILAAKAIRDDILAIAARSGQADNLTAVAAAILNQPANESYYSVALWLYNGGTTAFIQDANSLVIPTDDLVEIIRFLKETLPSITRVTSYARSKTAAKKSLDDLKRLHDAGLTRLHVGLESGSDPVLASMDKGVTAAEHIEGGQKIVASGISLCTYFLLGLGGKTLWREHALETARVLNEINPDFIRVRTMTIKAGMPLFDEVNEGRFLRETDEELIEEEKLLLENLTCHSNFISDHITNLLQEIEGHLPEDKEKLLAVIARFQALPTAERLNFRLGRRLAVYERLDDLQIKAKHDMVQEFIDRFAREGRTLDESVMYSLMERFI